MYVCVCMYAHYIYGLGTTGFFFHFFIYHSLYITDITDISFLHLPYTGSTENDKDDIDTQQKQAPQTKGPILLSKTSPF